MRLALESLFATLAGVFMLGERLTAIGALGCALVLAGAVASKIGPLFGRSAARRAK